MLDIADVERRWTLDQPKFFDLGGYVSERLKERVSEKGFLPEISFRTKELVSIIKKIKTKLAKKDYSYDHLSDKLGIRLICNYNSELAIVDAILSEEFDILKTEFKQEELDFDRLSYISNHYDAKLKKECSPDRLQGMTFEIQVRTLNQHAWSNIAHELAYKQDTQIPGNLKRKIYRLLSLYEIADDEFEVVNQSLIHHPDSRVYSILKKLEKFIYRFARIDYDRQISIEAIRILLEFFEDDEQISINLGIEGFVKRNESKIKRIFEENRIRFHEMTLLTQPEVFLVWYCLVYHQAVIEENWGHKFDDYELDQIHTIWGKEIE